MVCLDHLRENGLLFEKKIFPLALFAHWEFPDLTSHLMAWHACSTHRKYLSSWREETETAIEETCSLYFEEFHWGDGREGRGNIPKKKSRLSYGRHGKTVIFHARKCDGTPQKKQILKTQVQELHETGGTLTGWEEFSFGISALFSLILARVEQTLKWVWIKSGLTDRKPFSYTKSNTWLYNFLTVPAVPLGHFAHPGLGDGGTGYCVLGWFLYNVPRSGLQTPLKATGFVSPGAGSPFAPLTHFAALCRERQKKVMCRETTTLLGVNTDTPGSRLMQAEGAFTWMP